MRQRMQGAVRGGQRRAVLQGRLGGNWALREMKHHIYMREFKELILSSYSTLPDIQDFVPDAAWPSVSHVTRYATPG